MSQAFSHGFLRRYPRAYRALDRLRWILGEQPPVRVAAGGGRDVQMACNRYSHVEQQVRAGIFEAARLDLFLGWLPGFCEFVDLGANVGLYSLLAARNGLRVQAFEPEPGNLRRLRANLRRNGLADRVTVAPVALGATSGFVRLHRPLSDNRGMATQTDPSGLPGHDGFRARREPFDQYASDPEQPTLVKCDVEGAEAEVLRGARQALRAARDTLWMVEVHRCYRVDADVVVAQFQDAGFGAVRWYDEAANRWSDAPATDGEPLLVAAKGPAAARLAGNA